MLPILLYGVALAVWGGLSLHETNYTHYKTIYTDIYCTKVQQYISG